MIGMIRLNKILLHNVGLKFIKIESIKNLNGDYQSLKNASSL